MKILLAVLMILALGATVRAMTTSNKNKIVFIGDSVTKGVPRVAEADTFAHKIAVARGWASYVNKGVGGDKARDGLARFQADVIDQHPDAVCICFGINDVWPENQTPVQEYYDAMKAMVQRAKAAGIRVTIITPNLVQSTPYINVFQPYTDKLRLIAYEEQVPLVDWYREIIDFYFVIENTNIQAIRDIYVDYQHPSALGHEFLTNLVLKPHNADACQ